MTFNMQPVTEGYGSIVDKNPFGVLGDVQNWKNTAHMRFAGDAIGHITKNVEQENYFKAQKELMQPQQSQGGMDWLDLAQTGVDIFGGLGGFGGGGGGAGLGGDSFAAGLGVDSGALDSALQGYGGYTSGMTSLY